MSTKGKLTFKYTCGTTGKRFTFQIPIPKVPCRYIGYNHERFGDSKYYIIDFDYVFFSVCRSKDCDLAICECHKDTVTAETDVIIENCKFILLMIDEDYKYVTDHDLSRENIASIYDAGEKRITVNGILREYGYNPHEVVIKSQKLLILCDE